MALNTHTSTPSSMLHYLDMLLVVELNQVLDHSYVGEGPDLALTGRGKHGPHRCIPLGLAGGQSDHTLPHLLELL